MPNHICQVGLPLKGKGHYENSHPQFITMNMCALIQWLMIRFGDRKAHKTNAIQQNLLWRRHQMEIFSALLALCGRISPVNSPHKYQWRGALMFSLTFALNKRWNKQSQGCMMTSSHENILCVIGPLCGECTGHWWIPLTKASDSELWCFLRAAGDLRRNRAHYDVSVIVIWDAIALIVTSL